MTPEDNGLFLDMSQATISFATSTYCNLEESLNMIDGQRSTFWATSGLYPQQFTLSFHKLVSVYTIRIRSYLVKILQIEKCETRQPDKFDILCEKEIEFTDTQHQVQPVYEGEISVYHIRFTILSGYDHICAIYKIEIQGSALSYKESIQEIPERDESHNKTGKEWELSQQKWQLPSTQTVQNVSETIETLSEPYTRQSDDRVTISEHSDDFMPLLTSSKHALESHVSSPHLAQKDVKIQPISHRSHSTMSLGSVNEMTDLPNPERSLTSHSAVKKSKLEMFTESEEISTENEF